MNLKLPNPMTRIFILVLLALCFNINAQQLKTQPDPSKTKKDQVYKNQKMFDSKTGSTDSKTPLEQQGDNAIERANYEFSILKNPYTGKIPLGIRNAEVEFSSKINVGNGSKNQLRNSENGDFSDWTNRGPFNVGGRTRALAIDRLNENVILAGGVSGGLWRSENGGDTWRKVTRTTQDPSITAIVQDPRPGRGFTWYYASGERSGNSAGSAGSFFQGSGIFKSQDGGRTWEQLRATVNESIDDFSIDEPFDVISSIVIDPTNGDIYVGTITGIQRSQDGGNSFAEVLSGGFDTFAEVAVTSTGQLYATMDSGSTPAGFFTSSTGDLGAWTNITPEGFPTTYSRTVIGIDPSNENTVYFLTQDNTAGGLGALLNRYDATEETYVDLSLNLPLFIGGPIGSLDFQGGYDMFVKVHPTNSNMVFVGGTNVYRSLDGFTTPTGQASWVAGYSPLNNVSLYTNQHPDQHALVFYPSNPNRVLSGNDGGVYRAEDITETVPGIEPVTWESLNNGYITTQPYHVAFDPSANSDDLVAGFQDNGTWFTNSIESNAIWESDFSGDGTYSAIADNGRTRYVSSQNGNVFRFNFDEQGVFESFSAVEPAEAGTFSFVNPFILDHNNDNIMYMPASNVLWRNNDLDGLPLFTNGAATENWVNVTSTPDGSTVSSLDTSTFPIANRLYYGTSTGTVFRMDNANIDEQEVIDLTTGKGLPAGFINDVNVDPSDADRVLITFSNYGIPSLFLTEDGGETWTNVSGNLEENTDGTGNGPSVRSTAFLGSEGRQGSRLQRIFVATSTGLYYTDHFSGQNTVWRKENNVLGNSVTDEVVTRKDGFIAIAAHGNGLFSARFPITNNPVVLPTLSTAFLLEDFNVVMNSLDIQIDITGLFVHSEGLPISIEVTNSNPELVTATLEGDFLTLSYTEGLAGTTAIGLIATAGIEQVSEGFTINVLDPADIPIYEQNDVSINSVPSQNFLDFGGIAQAADDFTIPVGNTWNIDRVIAFGGANGAPTFDNVIIIIYDNDGGAPGEEIYNSGDIFPISDLDDSNLNIELPQTLTLESGEYWISIYVNLPFGAGDQWFWNSEANSVGQVTQFRDVANLFGTGAVDWTPTTVSFGTDPLDQTFQIFGDIINTSVQNDVNQEASPLVTLDSQTLNSLAWPNPSTGVFNFNLNSFTSEKEVSISIFDINGKIVYQESGLESRNNYAWDASKLSSGFYIVNVKSENISKRFKIIKN